MTILPLNSSAPSHRRRSGPLIPLRLLLLLFLTLPLGACVAAMVVGTTVAVTAAVVTAPVKVGGAVVDAVTCDEEEEKCDD